MKTLKIFIAALTLACLSAPSFAQSMDDAQAKYGEGVEKLKAKDYAGSAALLTEAMNVGFDLGDEGLDIVKEIQGLLPKVYLQAGVAELRTSNFDGAFANLQKAFDMSDLYGDVTTMRQASRMISNGYQMKGAAAFNEKDYATALESFSKGYEQDPSNIKLALFTAKSNAELGNLEKALEIYQGVIDAGAQNSKFESEAAEAQKDITTYLLVAASNAAEKKDLDRVLEIAKLAPTNPDIALMSMQVANNLKKYSVIISGAEAAANAQSDEAKKSDIFFMLGDAYTQTGNKAEAITALQKVASGNNVAAAKARIVELKK